MVNAIRQAAVTVEGEPRLLIPSLAVFYEGAKPLAYALLRTAFGLTIVTHGVPKLFGLAHGSMADPMGGSINLIANVLRMPFAPQLAMFVAVLETFGGIAVAVGLGTRVAASMLGVQMLFISVALGPTYPWVDRGMEYPVMLGFVALLISIHGSGAYSIARRIGRDL